MSNNELHIIKASLLEVIREEPDITWVEMSKRIGHTPGNTWLALSSLRQEGKVKQSERGWRVTRPGERLAEGPDRPW